MADKEEIPAEVSEDGLKIFSMEEVEKHIDPKDDDVGVWTVIHDRVYDVTKFLDEVSIQCTKVIGNVFCLHI